MRRDKVFGVLGRFLQVYGLLAFVPIPVAYLYSEPSMAPITSFVVMGVGAMLLGTFTGYLG